MLKPVLSFLPTRYDTVGNFAREDAILLQADSLSPLSPRELALVQHIYVFMSVTAYAILIWDWIACLPLESKHFWQSRSPETTDRKSRHSQVTLAGQVPMSSKINRYIFLSARYGALALASFIIAIWASLFWSDTACSMVQYWYFGFALVGLATHTVMALRLYAIYGRARWLLATSTVMTAVDFAAELVAGLYLRPILLEQSERSVCIPYPTSSIFLLAFIAPTILHHTHLVLIAWRAFTHFHHTETLGISAGRRLMQSIRQHAIVLTLAICLVNFANLVLCAQPNPFAYKLVNLLPSMCLTQVLLSRIVFSLKSSSSETRRTTTSSLLAASLSSASYGEVSSEKASSPTKPSRERSYRIEQFITRKPPGPTSSARARANSISTSQSSFISTRLGEGMHFQTEQQFGRSSMTVCPPGDSAGMLCARPISTYDTFGPADSIYATGSDGSSLVRIRPMTFDSINFAAFDACTIDDPNASEPGLQACNSALNISSTAASKPTQLSEPHLDDEHGRKAQLHQLWNEMRGMHPRPSIECESARSA
ncbi:hypothetical protein E5Q_06686 [Mixia osmundae IAM 14324]|uniref:Uncharacterized protein n=1 Tax=Mixia osmundae (strain CBS 9802 / IAM 14324 / JCM 22182 / KY 12970) TaxID=764103 RepID=G7EAX3_MIXOS|nr:hypothetical protein E5Q_06686 [Mixia osmundae IAM 14324]